ncbi:hypothetical protein AT5A_24740 [Agrobacterium tumefaciens 5A]|nr:hypothetical protein AT5A_24740 [Agrobacterium tumefaciens 5A]
MAFWFEIPISSDEALKTRACLQTADSMLYACMRSISAIIKRPLSFFSTRSGWLSVDA